MLSAARAKRSEARASRNIPRMTIPAKPQQGVLRKMHPSPFTGESPARTFQGWLQQSSGADS